MLTCMPWVRFMCMCGEGDGVEGGMDVGGMGGRDGVSGGEGWMCRGMWREGWCGEVCGGRDGCGEVGMGVRFLCTLEYKCKIFLNSSSGELNFYYD